MKETLVAVMTCHLPQYRLKADAIRETWAPGVREHADVLFFSGRPATSVYQPEDEIYLDVPTGYAGIPLKVQALCQWATGQGYKQVLKCDDDVYIVPKRFAALPLAGFDYVGRFRGAHGRYPAPFASGFGYGLSNRSMQAVARHEWNHDWMDERFVANVLAYNGISGHTDPVNYLVTGPHISAERLAFRQTPGTVFCEYNHHQLWELHSYLKDFTPGDKVTLQPLPLPKITLEQLNAPPLDAIPKVKAHLA